MEIKVIKTEEDYKASLDLMESLILKSPDPESEDGLKLSLLAIFIEDYENKILPESLPDPIDAILFRMEQENLKPADLVKYIGSRSKVSEILAGKRPLTLSMIRSLEAGLGIPAKVLLKESNQFKNIDWNRFPIKEMIKKNYFVKKILKPKQIKDALEKFFNPLGLLNNGSVMLKKSNYRSTRPINKYALIAWTGKIIKEAMADKGVKKFDQKKINITLMTEISKFSIEDNGPILAINHLKKFGILIVIEPRLEKTYLDGATIITEDGHPIIGLTLRHDRIDYFWFTLMHELAHVAMHYKKDTSFFDYDLENEYKNSILELEADKMAGEALIPENKWENSPAKLIPSPMAAESLAKELGIHTAIVAGKIRHVGGKYFYLNNIIKEAKIRQYFSKINWNI